MTAFDEQAKKAATDGELTPGHRFAIAHVLAGLPIADSFRRAFPEKADLTRSSLANAATAFRNSKEVQEAVEQMRHLASGKSIQISTRIMCAMERDILAPIEWRHHSFDADIDAMDEEQLKAALRAAKQHSETLEKQLHENNKKPYFRLYLSDYEKLAKFAANISQAVEGGTQKIFLNMSGFGPNVDGRYRHRREIPVAPEEWGWNGEEAVHQPSYLLGRRSAESNTGGLVCEEAKMIPGADPSKCFYAQSIRGVGDTTHGENDK